MEIFLILKKFLKLTLRFANLNMLDHADLKLEFQMEILFEVD